MRRIEPSIVFPVVVLSMVVVFIGTLVVTTVNRYKIKPAVRMADKAFAVRHEETRYSELRKSAVIMINSYASKGANSVEIYVGRYDDNDVEMLKRDLINAGYKVEMKSPLSGTNDFMEITW